MPFYLIGIGLVTLLSVATVVIDAQENPDETFEEEIEEFITTEEKLLQEYNKLVKI